MKAIIQSVNPEHVFNMRVSGKRFPLKRIEVRKSAPKETPFKAYIYETKQKEKSFVSTTIDGVKTEVIIRRGGCGKVVGEYICRKVEIVRADNMIQAYYSNRPETRVTDEQLFAYANGRPLKFLYMEDVIFYDKPKELGEFWAYNKELHNRFENEENFCCYDGTNEYGELINECAVFNKNITRCYSCWEEWSGWCHRITRPPQSWCYVEELEE